MAISWVRGEFQSVTGSLGLDGDDITRSRFAVDIDSASVHTGDVERDRHLRSADFLDAQNYPVCIFDP
ncbi:MAG: YceI family protein [Ignavibacteriota bacterium]